MFSGISVLLVLSLTPIVLNEAFAGIPSIPRTPLPTVGPIGDFRCWSASGPQLPPIVVGIEDQFVTRTQVGIGRIVEFCASAEKRYDDKIFPSPFGINPGQHFTGYDIIEPPLPEPETHSVFIPQFNLLIPEITVRNPVELLVPTTKIIPNVIESPSQTDLHYKCYSIENPPTITLPPFSIATQFGAEDVKEPLDEYTPFLFCNPAIKNHQIWDPPLFGKQIDEHLICFPNIGQDTPRQILFDNQFTPQPLPLTLFTKDKICFEALKDFNPGVGGQMIPIDTSALLLVGAQSTSWLIPVVVSALGIGLIFVRRR